MVSVLYYFFKKLLDYEYYTKKCFSVYYLAKMLYNNSISSVCVLEAGVNWVFQQRHVNLNISVDSLHSSCSNNLADMLNSVRPSSSLFHALGHFFHLLSKRFKNSQVFVFVFDPLSLFAAHSSRTFHRITDRLLGSE